MISPKPLSDARGMRPALPIRQGLQVIFAAAAMVIVPWTTEPRGPKAAPAAGATVAQRVNKSSLTVARRHSSGQRLRF
jgi:hypothetical protein